MNNQNLLQSVQPPLLHRIYMYTDILGSRLLTMNNTDDWGFKYVFLLNRFYGITKIYKQQKIIVLSVVLIDI